MDDAHSIQEALMNSRDSDVIEGVGKRQQERSRPLHPAQAAELGAKRPQLLDKEGLAAKLLECADEKIIKSGQVHYANDAKDRLGFFRLYAEVMGFVGNASIEAATDNFTNNEMKVILVGPEDKHDSKAAIESIVNKGGDSPTIVPLIIKPV
jgi:hypothetical protein